MLSGFDEIKVCTAYRYNGKESTRFPTETHTLEKVEPVYDTLPGWDEDVTGASSEEELPANARRYLEYIAEAIGVKEVLVSIGPKRHQTIHLGALQTGTPA